MQVTHANWKKEVLRRSELNRSMGDGKAFKETVGEIPLSFSLPV